VLIPRKGRPGAARQAVQHGRSFRKLVKWRTGSEARISCLKRDYGWRRTLTDGEAGAATWCGWGVLAHNATKISGLIADTERQRAGPKPSRERPERAAA
jgi:IS5 family transposase